MLWIIRVVKMIKDYLSLKSYNIEKQNEEDILLPKSNVLQFFLEDNTKITVRPSGTEPKIKFYLGVKENSLEQAKKSLEILGEEILKYSK